MEKVVIESEKKRGNRRQGRGIRHGDRVHLSLARQVGVPVNVVRAVVRFRDGESRYREREKKGNGREGRGIRHGDRVHLSLARQVGVPVNVVRAVVRFRDGESRYREREKKGQRETRAGHSAWGQGAPLSRTPGWYASQCSTCSRPFP